MYFEELGWVESPFNPNRPDPRFILYDNIGREILSHASRESGRIFYVYAKPGMGKTTLAYWMNQVSELYRLEPALISGANYDPESVRRSFKKITSGPSFFEWIIKKLRKKPLMRYFIIVDDATEIDEKEFFENIRVLLEIPKRHVSVCFLGDKVLDEWPMRKIFTNRSIITYELLKPPKEKILEMIRSRIESVGGSEFYPLTLDEVISIIEEKETIRDILMALEEKVIEKVGGTKS